MASPKDDRFEALFEAAPDAMICVSADGRIALVNAETERLFGYPRSEMIGEPVEMLIPERSRGIHESLRVDYLGDLRPRPMGVDLVLAGRRRGGSEFPAEISLSAIETDDGLLITTSVRDISARLELQAERERLRAAVKRERSEAQLQQSQRLESLGQLAGGVAHDFNNLLAVMINYSSFVREAIAKAPQSPSLGYWRPVLDDVDQIVLAGKRATELTRQLLAFARREIIRPQVLDINTVIRNIAPLLHRILGEDVELTTSLAPEVWPVLADPGQIEQVLVNLVVNSRDAMPSGGTLTIDTHNIAADAEFVARHVGSRLGSYARLRVSDTGAGMSAEVRDRVFEPFFTTKAQGEGSGLGLSTVYGIINQAGGYAQVYSEPGFGTTFSALLPAADAPVIAVADARPPKARDGTETILVVEDEDAMREVTRRILDRHGYTVLQASSGAEAIDVAHRRPDQIDLVLTDVIMPQMTGTEVAARLQVTRPELRVLYMSGYAQPVLARKGTLDPGVLLLEKPFSEDELLTTIRKVLDTKETATTGLEPTAVVCERRERFRDRN